MAVYKNKASQKVACFAYDPADGSPVTGDAANITAQISKDGAATAATNDTNPTELDATDAPGIYLFDLTQAETNADLIIISPVTANATIEPIIIYSEPEIRQSDLVQIGQDAQSMTDLKDFADAGYDPSTNKVQGVVLVDDLSSGALAAIAIAIIEAFGATVGQVEDEAGNSSSVFQTGLAESADDYYNKSVIVFTTGTNANQFRRISDYAGSTGTITVAEAFDAEPGTGDQFLICGRIE